MVSWSSCGQPKLASVTQLKKWSKILNFWIKKFKVSSNITAFWSKKFFDLWCMIRLKQRRQTRGPQSSFLWPFLFYKSLFSRKINKIIEIFLKKWPLMRLFFIKATLELIWVGRRWIKFLWRFYSRLQFY